MTGESPRQKEKKYLIQISQDLMDIFEIIRKNVAYNTWDAEQKLSYYKASKILAARIKKTKIY